MHRLVFLLVLTALFQACKPSADQTNQTTGATNDPLGALADSVLFARHNYEMTDILSRKMPLLTREQAFAFQVRMLKKELAAGNKVIGYKMGGTAVPNAESYDPMFGYMLDANLIAEDSVVSAENFPGGSVLVEAEIGFKLKKDFPQGVNSMEELRAGVDYVLPAVEFAKAVATPIAGDPGSMTTNHILASGMGHAGVMLGQGRADVNEFDFANESAQCLINGEVQAEGISANIHGTPLNALYSLANQLPEHGLHLKSGDVVVTGSLYTNPSIDSTSTVQLQFSTLGEIGFKMK
jgi:2-oxo-hept-3-ene-1,7-dioate hydratase